MTDRELMQQALEALEFHVKNADEIEEIDLALVTALRERLAQPEQEPVAWRWRDVDGFETIQSVKPYHKAEPLYTAPQQRKPLTDEEIWALHDGYLNPVDFARAIEAAHGIKENT